LRSSEFLIEGQYLTVTDLDGASSEKGDDDGDNVDGQLELQELCDAVVDVTTPHHRLHDTRKVVISQDDVRRFLCYVRTRYSLRVCTPICRLPTAVQCLNIRHLDTGIYQESTECQSASKHLHLFSRFSVSFNISRLCIFLSKAVFDSIVCYVSALFCKLSH